MSDQEKETDEHLNVDINNLFLYNSTVRLLEVMLWFGCISKIVYL